MYTPKRLGRRAPCGSPAANGRATAAHGVHSEEPSRQTAGSNGWKARLAAPPAPGCLVQAQFLFESPCVFAAHGRGIPLSGNDDAATQRDHRTSPSPMFTDPSDLAHASATRLPTVRRCRPEGGGWTDRDRTAAFLAGSRYETERNWSLLRSAIAMIAACGFTPGASGRSDASLTRRFWNPQTRPKLSAPVRLRSSPMRTVEVR
jgi:hypothetical protein